MKIVVAIDSFKGCLSSTSANSAVAAAILSQMPAAEVIQMPVSDGGDGWLEAFRAARGGELVEVAVRDPLLRPIFAQYLVSGDTAVIEMAKASGLTLLDGDERNPMVATSYGTGQLVVDAVRRGCRHIIVGLGGSATSDCGFGMLCAIADAFAPAWNSGCLPTTACNWAMDDSWRALLDAWDTMTALRGVGLTIATDVTNPLCGLRGAAHVFAPQKGATPEMVVALEARAGLFADASASRFGYDRRDVPGAGAAGGVGYAFLQFMNAECRSGIDLLLEAVRFDEQLAGASLVITGEGSADRQTLMGKLPYGILRRALARQVPVWLLAGRVANRRQLLDAGFASVECINPPDLSLEEAMNPDVAMMNIGRTIARHLFRQ